MISRWVVVGVALVSGSVDADASHYYAYTDDAGVLHVTNVPEKRAGAWALWKSVESMPAKGAPAAARAPQRMVSEIGRARRHAYDGYIRRAADRYQLPESLLRAVIHTESNYNSRALSRVGAMGLMQLMPATARSLGVEKPYDPQQNIFGGARYLRLLANRYGGDMVLVLAAYNAGAGNVEKYGGVPPFAETRAYVQSTLRRFYAYERQAQAGGSRLRREPARHIAP